MKPIGLTLKNRKTNPYTHITSGEPMIIHLCLNCKHLSCNRIAADDNPHTIIQLLNLDLPQDILKQLRGKNIHPLSLKDKPLVLTAIYGYSFQKYIQ